MSEPIIDYDTQFDDFGSIRVVTEKELKRRHAVGWFVCKVKPHEWMYTFDLVNGTGYQTCGRCGKVKS